MTSSLLPILPVVDDVLFNFAQSDGFWANLAIAFGTSYDVVKATELRQQWQSRNFSQIPPIEVLSDEVLGTANGAYSSSTNKIYLSASFLNTASSATIVNVILEEIGHYVDAQINPVDGAGDEGAIFALLVMGETLSTQELQALKAEDDTAYVTLNGQQIQIEQQNFTGTNGNDNITGTADNDVINGLGGNDTLSGLGGNDSLNGNEGNDRLYGGEGNDHLSGDEGDDKLYNDSGSDILNGGSGFDHYDADYSSASTGLLMTFDSATGNGKIVVGTEIDTLISIENFTYFQGTNFDDIIVLSSSNDQVIHGNQGNDNIQGNEGNEYLYGDEGDDILNGGKDNDVLYGGTGNDTIYGGLGSDYLYGDEGDDVLIGVDPNIDDPYTPNTYDAIQDTFYGDEGRERFVLGNAHKIFYNEDGNALGGGSRANINNFNRNEDIIQLHGSSDDYLLYSRIEVNYPAGLTYLELKNPNGSGYEIIAIIYGQLGLSLTDSYFQYVSTNQQVFTPTLVGTFDTPGNAKSVQVVGNYAYVADGNSGLQIIDISNPQNPVLKGSYNDNYPSDYHSAEEVEVDGNYAYIAAGSGGLEIVDISNHENLILTGSYDQGILSSSSIFKQGLSVYINDWPDVFVVDVSDPEYPTIYTSNPAYEIGNGAPEFIYTENSGIISNVGYVNDTWVSNYVYMATNDGLEIFKTPPYNDNSYFSDYVGLIDVGYLSGLGSSEVISVQDTRNYTYLIVGDGQNDSQQSLVIMDIDITSPNYSNEPYETVVTVKGTYALPDDAYDLQVVDNIVYVANGNSGLQIIDVSDPTNPTFKGHYDTSGTAVDVWIENNYAYVADGNSGLQIIDLFAEIAPTNLSLSNNSIAENQAIATVIGNFSSVDPNTGDVFIYTLIHGEGSTDNALFAIQNGQLKSNTVFDYETKNNYSIRVRVTDQGGLFFEKSLTINITDVSESSIISLTVSPTSVTEDGTANLVYTFTRTGATTSALTVNYSITGTANSTDYTGATPGTGKTITFAPGSSTATLTIDPTADTTVEANETVALTLATGTGYTVGTTTAVTGTITNDDLPSITLAVSPASVTEDGTTNLVYTFTRSGSTTNALTVNYTLGGTATLNTDYTRTGTTNTVTFAAGSSTATVTVDPKTDTTVESNETIALTLASGTGYTVGTTTAVTGTITNDDFSQLSINNITVVEGQDSNAILTVTVNNPNPQPISVNYTTAPVNATANVDYTSKTGTLTIAANTSTATISIPILNDNLNEANETFAINLSNPVNATLTNNKGIVTISDTLTANVTTTLPANVENLTLTGTTNINGTGNTLNNVITGNSGNNILNGATGIDTLVGGLGNDTYQIDTTTDTITENANQGTDTVQSSVTYTLGNNLENLTLTGTTNINGIGNTLNNIITGNSGNNILNGATGIDTLIGGLGNDTYQIDTTTDTITENANQGTDTVQSSVTYTLGNNLENLTLTGTTNINGTGNTLNNVITGNSGNNILNGATGIDTLIGGLGNDTYQIDTTTDTITENANQGTDTVQSSVTYTLGNNLENLRLIGSNNINGTGNAGNNNITGNSGINQINGGAGIDTLTGGLGADTFIFQFGQSTISTSDLITDFAINSDKIDLLTQAGNATSAPSNFSRAANSTVTTLQNLINQVFTDANGAITGNQGLGVNSAALVQVTTGAIAGTYLVINDSTAGFQSSNDLLINITGFTGTLPALGNIPVGNFFV
jgi:Ca2+-binding RTX toxin-like protein